MMKMRKNFDGAFKGKVALEAIKGEKTLTQIASDYKIHVSQIRQWKKRLLEEIPGLFFTQARKESSGSRRTDVGTFTCQIGANESPNLIG